MRYNIVCILLLTRNMIVALVKLLKKIMFGPLCCLSHVAHIVA